MIKCQISHDYTKNEILGRDAFITEYQNFNEVKFLNWRVDNFNQVRFSYANAEITLKNLLKYYPDGDDEFDLAIDILVQGQACSVYLPSDIFMPLLKIMFFPYKIHEVREELKIESLFLIISQIFQSPILVQNIAFRKPQQPKNFDLFLFNCTISYKLNNQMVRRDLRGVLDAENIKFIAKFIKNQSNFMQLELWDWQKILFNLDLYCGHATIKINEYRNLGVGDIILLSREIEIS